MIIFTNAMYKPKNVKKVNENTSPDFHEIRAQNPMIT